MTTMRDGLTKTSDWEHGLSQGYDSSLYKKEAL